MLASKNPSLSLLELQHAGNNGYTKACSVSLAQASGADNSQNKRNIISDISCSIGGAKQVTQHQLHAFTTIVDQVYAEAGDNSGNWGRQPSFREPPPTSGLNSDGDNSENDYSHHQTATAISPPASIGYQPTTSQNDTGTDNPPRTTSPPPLHRHLSIAATLLAATQIQTSLPTFLLPRRWTDGAAALAAAANVMRPDTDPTTSPLPSSAACQDPAQDPPPPPPCRLLELPNDLLLLITLAAVSPPGSSPTFPPLPAGPSSPSRTTATTPRGSPAPNSPGWSFALIASPNPNPRQAAYRRRGNTHRTSGAGGGLIGRFSLGSAEGGDGSLEGLRAVAVAAMTCRRLRGAYRLLLAARPDLELQAEAALRSLHEKRQLVRRLTINQHDTYVARELAAEGAVGVAVAAAVVLLCGACGACTAHSSGLLAAQQAANYGVFTAVHVLLHTAILAVAYRTSAWLGTRRSLALGLLGQAAYYLILVPAAKALLLLPPVPPHLNLEPWHRRPTDPPPTYLLAALLWPLYGDGIHWRLIHLLSNGFAWVYGAYEWHHSFSRVRLRNGLRY